MHLDNIPKLRKVVQDSTLFEVIGHYSTAWRQTRLDIGLHSQTTFYCLLGQKSCKKNEQRQWFAEHPVSLVFIQMLADNQPAPSMTDGLLVLVQLVIAAMTTEP